MFRAVVAVAFLSLVCAVPRIGRVTHRPIVTTSNSIFQNLEGYQLFQQPAGGLANFDNQWAGPLPASEQLPQSARTLHFFWDPAGATNTAVNPAFGTQTFDIEFTGAVAAAQSRVKLEAPFLEVDPAEADTNLCPAHAAAHRSCRCNVGDANTPYEPEDDIDITPVAVPGTPSTMRYTPPVFTYFTHAPYPGQNPYMRTFRRICLEVNDANGQWWLDTTLYFAVEHSCVDGLTDAANVDPNSLHRCDQATQLTNNGNQLYLERNTAGNLVFPTANTGSIYGFLGLFLDVNGNGANRQQITSSMNQQFEIYGESEEMRDARLKRSQCCGALGANVIQGLGVQFGVCIDPAVSDCCGRRPYERFNEKCCSRHDSRIGNLDQPCPCITTRTIDVGGSIFNLDCNAQGPNDLTSNVDDKMGITQGVTTDRSCCAMSKYPTYNNNQRSGIFPQAGFCTLNSPTAAEPWRCCDDGNVYDPASYQCCPVNGIQTLNIACPCTADSQCPSENGAQKCCLQWFPPAFPPNVGPGHCSSFANYPMPGAPAGVVPQIAEENFLYHARTGFPYRQPVPATSEWVQSFCPGRCYRASWEICCNGVVCVNEYERCCNSTCCNRFTSSCTEGQRPGAIGSRANPVDYDTWFEVCTEKENLTSRRSFLVFALPVMLLFATLLGLAIVVVLARRATEHTFDLTEKVLVVVAAISVLIATTFYFSPNYRYGLFIAFVDIIAIMVSVIRKKRYSLLLVILLVLKVLLLVDPFAGNIFLSFTGGVPHFSHGPEQEPVNVVGRRDLSSSLYDATQRLWKNPEECVDFYDFFMFDDAVRDTERIDNPLIQTYGYCSRAWIVTLLVMTALLYALQFLLLLLAIFSLAKKWGRKPAEPVQLEVIQEPGY